MPSAPGRGPQSPATNDLPEPVLRQASIASTSALSNGGRPQNKHICTSKRAAFSNLGDAHNLRPRMTEACDERQSPTRRPCHLRAPKRLNAATSGRRRNKRICTSKSAEPVNWAGPMPSSLGRRPRAPATKTCPTASLATSLNHQHVGAAHRGRGSVRPSHRGPRRSFLAFCSPASGPADLARRRVCLPCAARRRDRATPAVPPPRTTTLQPASRARRARRGNARCCPPARGGRPPRVPTTALLGKRGRNTAPRGAAQLGAARTPQGAAQRDRRAAQPSPARPPHAQHGAQQHGAAEDGVARRCRAEQKSKDRVKNSQLSV